MSLAVAAVTNRLYSRTFAFQVRTSPTSVTFGSRVTTIIAAVLSPSVIVTTGGIVAARFVASSIIMTFGSLLLSS